ncbi:MAG: DNA primase [Kofleriaceae bacterium]
MKDQIRDKADIVAVIGQHVQLKKAGRNWKGLCPFHGEKTPSFNVHPDRGTFYCFGCQKKGDVFTFVMEIEGKGFLEAAEQLAAMTGVELPKYEENPDERRRRGEKLAMLDINKIATAFYREMLASPRGEPGRAYLAKRGVSTEIADKFLLGYAPPEWGLLADHLKAKRVDMNLAMELGLVRARTQQGGYYDLNRDRLVCPVVMPGGEVWGFSSRTIGGQKAPDGSEPPKYINSPESRLYKKSQLLFGLAQARESIQASKRVVLVEGNFDVITLHQAGFGEVVAPLGTAITPEQVNKLKKLAERIVLLYDGDKAGYKATMHALQLCVEADVEVQVARRPGNAASRGAGTLGEVDAGSDPDSLVSGGGAQVLRESIDRALGGIEFFAFDVWGRARNNSDARARALEDAGRLLAKVANPVKRDLLVHTLATAMGVDIAVVANAIARAHSQSHAGHGGYGHNSRDSHGRDGHGRDGHGRYGASHPNDPSNSRASQGSRPDDAGAPRAQTVPPIDELEVITLLADHPSLIATAEADKAFWLLTDARLRDMYSAARDGQPLLESAPVQLPKPSAEYVLSGKYAETKDPRAELLKMVTNLGLRSSIANPGSLGASLQDTLARMKDAERRGDRKRASLFAQLLQAERKSDREEIVRLKDLLAQSDTTSAEKKVD